MGRKGPKLPIPLSPYPPISLSSLLLIPILALAAFLRFYALDASSLWSDEGNTWALIQRSFAQIARDAAADIHPPGYYWLLKLWSMPFGTSAFAMRSLSALCGVLLVWVVYQIGLQLANSPSASVRFTQDKLRIPHSAFRPPHSALLAALLAAINPFAIYYSQETRMYMLLALESAGLVWAVLEMGRGGDGEKGRKGERDMGRWGAVAVYAICAGAGLWTHYSFPIVLVAAGIYWVFSQRPSASVRFTQDKLRIPHPFVSLRTSSALRTLLPFSLANLLALLAFLPWLPTALVRVFAWPNQGSQKSLSEVGMIIARTLWFGPLSADGWIATIGIGLVIVLPLLGIWQLRRDRRSWLLILWLLFPIGLMLGAGLFREAYLKFLLVASPAWALLAVLEMGRWGDGEMGRKGIHYALRTTHYALLALLVFTAYPTLHHYYANPVARDNFQGVARYVAAMGDPLHDLVLLDAPGQADVWRYYDPGVPVLALPQQRPPDEAQTIATLTSATRDRQQIFALFWATDEADPSQIVERWLDANAFKGLDQWQGNLRFVTYAFAHNLQCQPFANAPRFGESIQLVELCQPQEQQQVYPGAAAIVGLRWQSSARLDRRYKVSVQLLDSRNQLIAQRDSEPGGGSSPTIDWQVGATIVDNHGLVIPAGVPPGDYRLIVALYDAESGQRLPTASGDFAEIGSITVVRPQKTIPVDVIAMQHRLNQPFASGLTLVGYDLYEQGFAHDPNKPIPPGAMAHLTLYWQAPASLSPAWTADQQFTLQMGSQTLTAPLAGGNYPTANWQPGEFVRGEFEIQFDGGKGVLRVGVEEVQIGK